MKITQVRAIVKEINEDVVITKLHDVCGGVVYEASIYGVVIYTFTMKQGKDITQVAWAELCEAIEGHNVANPNDVVIEALQEAIEGTIEVEFSCDMKYGKKYNVRHNGDLVYSYMIKRDDHFEVQQRTIEAIIANVQRAIEDLQDTSVDEQGDNMNNYEGLTKREIQKIEDKEDRFVSSEYAQEQRRLTQEANDFEMRSFNIEDASEEIFRHCEELGVNDGIVIRHIQGRHAEDALQRYAVIFKGYTVTTFILSSIQPGDEHTTNGTIINRVKWDIASFISDYYNPDQYNPDQDSWF